MDIVKASAVRYKKIQDMIDLLKGEGSSEAIDAILKNSLIAPFKVGKSIFIDGDTIKIGKKEYYYNDIDKVTVNTEGSMALYDRYGKKLCGSFRLNLSCYNIQLFCIWARLHGIPVEVVSGKKERIFQFLLLAAAFIAIVLYKVLDWIL